MGERKERVFFGVVTIWAYSIAYPPFHIAWAVTYSYIIEIFPQTAFIAATVLPMRYAPCTFVEGETIELLLDVLRNVLSLQMPFV